MTFEQAVQDKLLKKMRRITNSKLTKLRIIDMSTEFEGGWKVLTVKGRAAFDAFNTSFYFDFAFYGNGAYEFLREAELEIPERPK